jgi:hypothetical protein
MGMPDKGILLDHLKVKDPLRIGGVGKYPVHPFQHQDVLTGSPHFDQVSAVRLVLDRVVGLDER